MAETTVWTGPTSELKSSFGKIEERVARVAGAAEAERFAAKVRAEWHNLENVCVSLVKATKEWQPFEKETDLQKIKAAMTRIGANLRAKIVYDSGNKSLALLATIGSDLVSGERPWIPVTTV